MPDAGDGDDPERHDLGRDDRATWTDFELAVAGVLESLVDGDVVTYGEVAAEAGHPGAHRAVGSMLRRSGGEFAWWRIVDSTGRLVPGHEVEQARRLASEGVRTSGGRVVEARGRTLE